MNAKNFGYNLCVFPLLLIALWQSPSCHNDNHNAIGKEQKRVATGDWGGDNIGLHIDEAGSRVRFSCAHGTIDEVIVLSEDGRFSAKGTFTAERPGPIREDLPPVTQPAVYEGIVKDETMTLAVILTKTKEQAGSFNLTYGKTGRVRRCL